jgi:hypothetical protein
LKPLQLLVLLRYVKSAGESKSIANGENAGENVYQTKTIPGRNPPGTIEGIIKSPRLLGLEYLAARELKLLKLPVNLSILWERIKEK